MFYLAAAVVLVGLLCLVNLVLTLGMVRRLRDQARLIQAMTGVMPPAGGVPVGEKLDEFTATTIAGAPMSSGLLADRTLVGFFSPGCQPCAEQLPRFVSQARSMPDGMRQVLAVVDAEPAGSQEYLERLGPVAQVVREGPDGAARRAFQVTGFPTFFLVGAGGVVLASGATMGQLEPELAVEVAPR